MRVRFVPLGALQLELWEGVNPSRRPTNLENKTTFVFDTVSLSLSYPIPNPFLRLTSPSKGTSNTTISTTKTNNQQQPQGKTPTPNINNMDWFTIRYLITGVKQMSEQQQPILPQDWEIVRTFTAPLALQQRAAATTTTTTTVDLRYALGNDGLVYWCRSHSPLLGEWRVRPLGWEEVATFLALYPEWEPMVSAGDRCGSSGLGAVGGREGETDDGDGDGDEKEKVVIVGQQSEEGSVTEDGFQDSLSRGDAAEGQTQGGHRESSQVISENGGLYSEGGNSEFRLPACSWHRYPAADKWAVEWGSGPELVLTTPEGEDFWLDDLAYYPGARSWAELGDEDED